MDSQPFRHATLSRSARQSRGTGRWRGLTVAVSSSRSKQGGIEASGPPCDPRRRPLLRTEELLFFLSECPGLLTALHAWLGWKPRGPSEQRCPGQWLRSHRRAALRPRAESGLQGGAPVSLPRPHGPGACFSVLGPSSARGSERVSPGRQHQHPQPGRNAVPGTSPAVQPRLATKGLWGTGG